MNSTEACIALNMLPTMGPVRLRKLLEVFRQPERVLTARRDELRRIEGIGNEVAEQISNWESIVDLAAAGRTLTREALATREKSRVYAARGWDGSEKR